MYTSQRKVLTSLNILLDSAIATLSWFAAFILKGAIEKAGLYDFKGLTGHQNWSALILLSIPLFPILLRLNKLYPTNRLRPFSKVCMDAIKSTVELVIIFVAFSFFSNEYQYNRSLIVLYGAILPAFFCLKEYWAKKIYLKYGNVKSAILIGKVHDVDRILEELKNEDLGLKIEGVIYFSHGEAAEKERKDKIPVFEEGVKNLGDILERLNIELVITASYEGFESDVRNILFLCGERGVEGWIKLALFGLRSARLDSGRIGNSHLLVFSTTPPYDWPIFIKTLFDFTVALIFFPVFCFLYLLIGIGIKLSSPGPVLFKQKRGGLYGKPFIFYKFRTMYNNAEQRREELQKFNIMKGPVFKVKDDPRVFPFGKFLRRTSLDEIAQIINVLKGEMSIVGPRPLPMVEVSQIKGWQRRRFSMKPGVTCLWQICGRNKVCDFTDWAKLDLEYIDHWSLHLDFSIFLKTIPAVLTRKGAE
ncbi:MAG: sugar transferase [Candidatus Omnitrophota bacterium]